MSIIKSKHASNYTVVPNEIFKSNLSIESIGLLTYLLHLPHDWVVYKTKLHEQLDIGREKLDRCFKELQKEGYVISVEKHSNNGRFEYEHIVYDKPFNGEPLTEKPYTGLSDTAEQPLLNKNLQSTKEQKKENKQDVVFDLDACKEKFDKFRVLYPTSKNSLETEFNHFKTKHKDWMHVVELLIPAFEKQTKFREQKKSRKEFVPEWKNFRTWINQRCWEEEFEIENISEVKKPLQLWEKDLSASDFPDPSLYDNYLELRKKHLNGEI